MPAGQTYVYYTPARMDFGCTETVRGRKTLGGADLRFEAVALQRGFRCSFPDLLHRSAGTRNLGALLQIHDAGVRDFAAKGLGVALLLVALFQEDGLPGVSRQVARGGQNDVSGAVRDHDTAA